MDGSLVEVNERTELSVRAAWSGQSVLLERGDVIVQAAKQRRGHLRVATRDSIASVKGTIFAVSTGSAGTLVSVVEGKVAVSQPGKEKLLGRGAQSSSIESLDAKPVREAVSWSADADKYYALLADFMTIEKKLAEMLRQLTQARRDRNVRIPHDGAEIRVFRDSVVVRRAMPEKEFRPVAWSGERRLALPALGGTLHFRRTLGSGIDESRLRAAEVRVRLRSGGERLQPDPRRPRRTLKNLFQEAGIPSWQRARTPLLFSGTELVWVPGLGVDVRYGAQSGRRAIEPHWDGSA